MKVRVRRVTCSAAMVNCLLDTHNNYDFYISRNIPLVLNSRLCSYYMQNVCNNMPKRHVGPTSVKQYMQAEN